jgi:hypothetical protein
LEATRARSRGTWAWPRWLPNSSTRSRRSPAASSALSSSASGTCRAPTRRPSPCGEQCGESSCQPPGGSRRAERPAPPGTPRSVRRSRGGRRGPPGAAGPQHPLDLGEHRRDVIHVGVHVASTTTPTEAPRTGRRVTSARTRCCRPRRLATRSCPADSSSSTTLRPVPLIRAAAAGQVQAPALAGAEHPGAPGGAAIRTRTRPATGDLVVPLCDRVAAHRAAHAAVPTTPRGLTRRRRSVVDRGSRRPAAAARGGVAGGAPAAPTSYAPCRAVRRIPTRDGAAQEPPTSRRPSAR